MNVIEKQAELGKSLYAINSNTLKEFASMQQENLQKYIETNRAFGEKLPEVTDISSFVELQREYSATIWANVKNSFEHQNELFRGAMEETRDAVKHAFTSEEIVEEKQKAKAKPKAKANAKVETKDVDAT
jgi:hypothetical protein